ncbi:MAG TPA: hypothetical protein PKL40_03925 [Methanoregulaceae archaeon]|nr:hypothetical protein [Methanoregulaceae archaeon]HOH81437.1 hypothetical protein [Methanoregulaceae archaeon]
MYPVALHASFSVDLLPSSGTGRSRRIVILQGLSDSERSLPALIQFWEDAHLVDLFSNPTVSSPFRCSFEEPFEGGSLAPERIESPLGAFSGRRF